MKKSGHFIAMLVLLCIGATNVFGQFSNKAFKLESKQNQTIVIDSTFADTASINPFSTLKLNKIYGLAATMDITHSENESVVRLILVDDNFNEYCIYESHDLLTSNLSVSTDTLCDETCMLDGVTVNSVRIEVQNASLVLQSLTYATRSEFGGDLAKWRKERKLKQNAYKIEQINKNLKAKGKLWVAGATSVSELTYSEKKELYGQSTFPPGFEYYVGGVMSTGTDASQESSTLLKSAVANSQYVDEWDWRNRHGRNWISPVTDQGACGSCWAFAPTAATEAMVNVYFNQLLHMDLSEQDLLSCSGGGDCGGGVPGYALNYISSKGIVDEATFPYGQADLACNLKGNDPIEKITINGSISFGSSVYPKSEDDLKRMLIEMGPLSSALYDWLHAMALVGYKVVKAGDTFYYRDLDKNRYWITVPEGDPLIGKTVWIYKNSWSDRFGDEGYVYVETPLSNIFYTDGITTPINSLVNTYDVVCEDRDGDGYYWWGLGPKPANCPDCPDLADGDDANPTKGPLDEFGYCMPLSGPVASPVAGFTANPMEISEGDAVTFSDASANFPETWEWTFEGGNPATSSEKNPAVTYAEPGVYNVKLIVANTGGADTLAVDGYITVNRIPTPPKASFIADKTTINPGTQVQFTDLSTNSPDSWSWAFEGGSPGTSTLQNPIITYENAGTFNVYLTVTNADGSDTRVGFDYINVTSTPIVLPVPVADFEASATEISTGDAITFTDLSTNSPTSWEWSFVGGTPSTSNVKNPIVIYDAAGTYSVSLSVSNSDGKDTKTVEGLIVVNELVAPVADFTSDKTKVKEGEAINFADKSLNNPSSWKWEFDGGNPSVSEERNPKVTYQNANSYKVTLTVTNAGGNNSKVIENYVQVEKNELAYCTVSGNTSSEWIKEVGINGQVKTSGASAGGYEDFTTSLVFDLKSGSNEKITLTPGFSPRSKFEYWGVWIDFNKDTIFSEEEKVLSSSKSKSAFTGSIPIPAGLDITTRMRVVMSPIAPLACGLLAGGEAEDYTVRISKPVPEADFTASSDFIYVGESIQFTNTSRYDPTNIQWYFTNGNPDTSTEENPVVSYSAPGDYDVTLIVSNDLGSSQKSMKISVYNKSDNVKQYCIPVNIDTKRNYISNVNIADFSSQSGPDGYQLPTSTIDILEAGQSYSIQLYPNSNATRNFWRIWIDFNNDGVFDESSETVYASDNIKGMASGNITIPSDAMGTTQMRISMKIGKVPVPCESDFSGEVEDYMVSFFTPQMRAAGSNEFPGIEPQLNLLVYPNPTKDKITIDMENVGLEDVYSIHDITGKKLMQHHILSNRTMVDLAQYHSGIYLVRVVNNNQIHNRKIIKR